VTTPPGLTTAAILEWRRRSAGVVPLLRAEGSEEESMTGENGLEAGRRLGLHDAPGGASSWRRGGNRGEGGGRGEDAGAGLGERSGEDAG